MHVVCQPRRDISSYRVFIACVPFYLHRRSEFQRTSVVMIHPDPCGPGHLPGGLSANCIVAHAPGRGCMMSQP